MPLETAQAAADLGLTEQKKMDEKDNGFAKRDGDGGSAGVSPAAQELLGNG